MSYYGNNAEFSELVGKTLTQFTVNADRKDIGAVMANQSDLVEVVAELRQVLCVKW